MTDVRAILRSGQKRHGFAVSSSRMLTLMQKPVLQLSGDLAMQVPVGLKQRWFGDMDDFDSDDDRFVVTTLRESIVSPSLTFNLHVKRLLVHSRAVLLKKGVSEEQYRVIFDSFISKMQSYQRSYFESEVFNEKR